jgi:hypothetical protein
LDSLIASHELSSIVTFPNRIQKKSHTIIENVFINTIKFLIFSIYPSINGLSDHDAQCLIIHDILKYNLNTNALFNRKFDKLSVADFNNKLRYELWDNVFNKNDVNSSFNNFLNTYLRLFNNLPTDLKQTFYDVYKFKRAIKTFLLDNSFYSVEEYYNWKENVFS